MRTFISGQTLVIDSDATSQTTVDDIAAALAATNLNSSEESAKRLDGPNDYYKDEVDQKNKERDKAIQAALIKLAEMEIWNEGGILTNLLESVDGDLNEYFDKLDI